MGSRFLTVNTILSAINVHALEWSPVRTRQQSREQHRPITGCPYDDHQGNLQTTHLTLGHSAFTTKIGVYHECFTHLMDPLKNGKMITPSSINTHEFNTICADRINTMISSRLIMVSKSHMVRTEMEQKVIIQSQKYFFCEKTTLADR